MTNRILPCILSDGVLLQRVLLTTDSDLKQKKNSSGFGFSMTFCSLKTLHEKCLEREFFASKHEL